MKRQPNHWRSLFLAALALVVGIGCSSTELPTVSAAPPNEQVAEIARDISKGVGEQRQIYASGTKGVVFIFEEFHTSRLGRIQSAVMLNRLYQHHEVKVIGLEGAYQSPRSLDGSWFHRAGGATAASAREHVAVRMLADGEINQAEFVMLLYPDVSVYGTERKEEHPTLDVKGNPEVVYLLGIAEKVISPQARRKAMELLQLNKQSEALDVMLNSDPWVKSHYDSMKDPSSTSLERVIERIRDIRSKADSLGAPIEASAKAEMQQVLTFYELRARASATMVRRVVELAEGNSGSPLAMIIGAAHTDLVAESMKREGMSFAVLRPRDLNSEVGSLNTQQFGRKQAGRWAWISPGALGKILNGESNSPPITQKATGRSYGNMSLACLLIAEAARLNKPLPDSVWGELSKLDEVRFDRASFTRDGYDVIFRTWLKDVNDKEIEVWARVGTTGSPSETQDLEQKLLAAEATIGQAAEGSTHVAATPKTSNSGGGNNAGDGTPSGTATEDHPERRKIGGREIVPVGSTALAIFANSKEDLGVARVSG